MNLVRLTLHHAHSKRVHHTRGRTLNMNTTQLEHGNQSNPICLLHRKRENSE